VYKLVFHHSTLNIQHLNRQNSKVIVELRINWFFLSENPYFDLGNMKGRFLLVKVLP